MSSYQERNGISRRDFVKGVSSSVLLWLTGCSDGKVATPDNSYSNGMSVRVDNWTAETIRYTLPDIKRFPGSLVLTAEFSSEFLAQLVFNKPIRIDLYLPSRQQKNMTATSVIERLNKLDFSFSEQIFRGCDDSLVDTAEYIAQGLDLSQNHSLGLHTEDFIIDNFQWDNQPALSRLTVVNQGACIIKP